MFGRRTRGILPTTTTKLVTPSSFHHKQRKEDIVASKVNNMNKTRKELSVLKQGQVVRLQPLDNSTQWKEGKVTKQLKNRTYEVEVNGKLYRRNRGFIRPVKKAQHSIAPEQQPSVPIPTPRRSLTTASSPAHQPQPSTPAKTPRQPPQPPRRSSPPAATHQESSSPVATPRRKSSSTAAQPAPPAEPVTDTRSGTHVSPVPARRTNAPNPEPKNPVNECLTTRSGRVVRPPKRYE